MIGWEKRVITPGDGLPLGGLNIPAAVGITSGWVTLAVWTKDDAQTFGLLGPSTMFGQFGVDLGDPALTGLKRLATFPKTIIQQWLRASSDAETQRFTHGVGASVKWAGGYSAPEKLTIEDYPLRFQVWQEGGVLVVRKAETCIDSPDSRIAAKVAP